MPIEYFQDDAFTDSVVALISDKLYTEFNPLREQAVKFLCAFVLRTSSEGEEEATTGDPVVIKKVSPADRVFIDGHYKLYADKHRWDAASDVAQLAMLHRALMRIDVAVDEEKGVHFGTRKPDVVEFQATVVRFGAWHESLVVLRNNLQAAQAKKAARLQPAGEERE